MRVRGTPMEKRLRVLAGLAGFVRGARAAVGLASVMLGSMSLMGVAMLGDQVWLFHQRNALQEAINASAVAAMKRMITLGSDATDEELAGELKPLVRRYLLANLPDKFRESAKNTLKVGITSDRDNETVRVEASAELGGALIGRHIWGDLVESVTVEIAAKRSLIPVDLVLSLDVTQSMRRSISNWRLWESTTRPEDTRIHAVKEAAKTLVGVMYAEGGEHVSIGLVPFAATVNVGATRTDWVNDLGKAHKVIPGGFGPWRGCVETRIGNGQDLSLATPGDALFPSWFYPYQVGYYSRTQGPHRGCPEDAIVPLIADRTAIEQAISNLRTVVGAGTMVHLGVVWGRRLLAPEWEEAWGLTKRVGDRKRVLVILTDGTNFLAPRWYRPLGSEYSAYGRAGSRGSVSEGYRVGDPLDDAKDIDDIERILDGTARKACKLAKEEGITVFAVSAVPHGSPVAKRVGKLLADCATSEAHVFANHRSPETMKAAFREIARKVGVVRLVKN